MASSMKALLKDARHHLDAGDFDRSIELCEQVLQQDGNHFTALLILGAAATAANSDHSAKALKALVHATEVKADQEAPWQGLLRLLRKYPTLDKALYRKTLEKVIEFTLDEKICVQLRVELAQLNADWKLLGDCLDQGASTNDASIVGRIVRVALDLCEDGLPANSAVASATLKKMLCFKDQLQPVLQDRLILAYMSTLAASDIPAEFRECASGLAGTDIHGLAVEVLVKQGVAALPPEELLQALESRQSDATRPEYVLAKAKLCLLTKNTVGLDESCARLLSWSPSNWDVWKMRVEAKLDAGCFRDAELLAKEAIQACDKQHSLALLMYLGRALHGQCRHREALVVLEKAEKLGAAVELRLRLQCLLGAGRGQEALSEAIAHGDKGYTLLARMELGEEFNLDNAHLNEVGMTIAARYLYYKKRYTDALKIASSAFSRDVRNAELLTLLGEIYTALGDHNRALKCLQQSFIINRSDARCGKALSRTLRLLEKHQENRMLLESLTSDGTIHDGNCWAFAELGLHFMERGEPSAAVGHLQKVTRLRPSSLAWELLAEAYAARKSFAAAALCLSKSIDLGSDHQTFLKYRLACVTRDHGRYEEAIELFEVAFREDVSSAICAHDYAHTCLSVARDRLRAALRGPARRLLSQALAIASQAICSGNGKLISLWNLLGDIMLQAVQSNLQLHAPVEATSRMLLRLQQTDVTLSTADLTVQAEKCFTKCLSLNARLPNVWHNLAIISAAKGSFDQSISCVKRAIALDSTSGQLWNTLGVLTVRAQHSLKIAKSAFIRALVLSPELAPAWVNLGLVYLRSQLLREANQCFTRAQAADPLSVECWLGQATLAATVGHFDACDLYRHSNEVQPTGEALVCYFAFLQSAAENETGASTNCSALHGSPPGSLEIPAEMLNACERAMDSFESRNCCATAGRVLLGHGLTNAAEKVLSRCDSAECRLMAAQASALNGDWSKVARYLENLPFDDGVTKLKAFEAWKKGRPEDAIMLVPEIRRMISNVTDNNNVEVRRKIFERSVSQDPSSEVSWRRLAECLLEEGRWSTASRVASFMRPPHQLEDLRLWAVASAMAGLKRPAYRAAASLVRNFPHRPEHWVLLRWTSFALEKRSVHIPGYDELHEPADDWKQFEDNVKALNQTLRSHDPASVSPFGAAGETDGSRNCRKLVELLSEGKFTKPFLLHATGLLKADPHSEAGLFLTGLWSVANSSEDLYTRCLKGLPSQSALRKLLKEQYIHKTGKKSTANNNDNADDAW